MHQANTKKYKTRHDRLGTVIYWELCKKRKFDHSTKCYIHNPENHPGERNIIFLEILRYKKAKLIPSNSQK